MQTTLKGFLAEQKKLGKNVPSLNENLEENTIETPAATTEAPVNTTPAEGVTEVAPEVAEYVQVLEESIKALTEELANIKNGGAVNEGFLDKIKNAVTGTIEFKVDAAYAGTPASQQFVTSDASAKIQIDQLSKKGLTPEEAKAAAMYVFDKTGTKFGFAKKEVIFNPETKVLTVKGLGGSLNPNLAA